MGRIVLALTLLLAGWIYISGPNSHLRPENVENICSIFESRLGWYKAAKASEAGA